MVVNDQFDSGGLPSHWISYNGAYGSGPHDCAIPAQSSVANGMLDMHFSYLSSGICGAGWYSAGLSLKGFSSIDARVSVRFRIVDNGASAHMIIPMRWPDIDSSWPAAGEEDFCEDGIPTCSSYLHYGASNSQVIHFYTFDVSQWHTVTFERLNHVVTATVDDTIAWTYTGDATTLPDTMKHVVLQQECQSSCPSGALGTEDIQIDFVTVEVPS